MKLFPIVSKEESRRAHEALPAQKEEAARDGLAAGRGQQPERLRPRDASGEQR
jgi:hypothetical protein